MNMILTTSIPESKKPGIYAFSDMSYKKHQKFWTNVFHSVNSKKAYEEIVSVNTFTQASRHTEGGQIAIMEESQGYKERVQMVYYSLGYILTVQEIQQNLYEKLARGRSERLANAHIHRREQEAADIFFNLADTLNRGDGVPLISDSHPTKSAGLQSNRISAQLSELALETAWLQIRTMRDGSGNLKNLVPKDLHVHPQNYIYARKLLETKNEVGTANNTKNVVSGYYNQVYDNIYMDDTEQWMVTTDLASTNEGCIAFEQVNALKEIQKLTGTLDTLYAEAHAYSHMIGNHRVCVGYTTQ